MKKIFYLKNLITIIFVCTFFISKAQTVEKQTELKEGVTYAFILDKTGECTIKKSELTTAEKLTTAKSNAEVKSNIEIISYEMELVVNKQLVKYYANSSYITPQMKNAIKKTIPNSRIYITNIVAKTSEGTIKNLKGINIKVTN